MKDTDTKRLKQREQDKGRLKKLVADRSLDNTMLKEVVKGELRTRRDYGRR